MSAQHTQIIGRCRHLCSEPEHFVQIFQRFSVTRQRLFPLRPSCCLWEQMGRQALIKGGHAGTCCVRAALHPEDSRQISHWSLRLQWLPPRRLHTLPDIWQRGRNEGRLRRTHRALELLTEAVVQDITDQKRCKKAAFKLIQQLPYT